MSALKIPSLNSFHFPAIDSFKAFNSSFIKNLSFPDLKAVGQRICTRDVCLVICSLAAVAFLALYKSLKRAKGRIAQLETQNTAVTTAVQQLTDRVTQLETLPAKVADLEAEKPKIVALQASLETLREEQKQFQQLITFVMQSKLNALSEKIALQHAAKVEEIQDGITKIGQEMGGLSGEQELIKESNTSRETALNEKMQSLRKDLDALRFKEVSEQEQNAKKLQQGLETVEKLHKAFELLCVITRFRLSQTLQRSPLVSPRKTSSVPVSQ